MGGSPLQSWKIVGNCELNPFKIPIWAWLNKLFSPHFNMDRSTISLLFLPCNPKNTLKATNSHSVFCPEHNMLDKKNMIPIPKQSNKHHSYFKWESPSNLLLPMLLWTSLTLLTNSLHVLFLFLLSLPYLLTWIFNLQYPWPDDLLSFTMYYSRVLISKAMC